MPVLANKPAARPSHMGFSELPEYVTILVAMGEGEHHGEVEERQKGKK